MPNMDNAGALFKNKDKRTEKHPDYTGSAMVDGVDYFMDAWLNESKNGVKYMGFRFKKKDKQSDPVRSVNQNSGAVPATAPDAARPPAPVDETSFFGTQALDEDIPF